VESSKELILSALSGKKPERVPVAIVSSAWVFSNYGVELSAAYQNPDLMTNTWRKFDDEFGADAVVPSLSSTVIPSYLGSTWKFPPVGFPLLQKPAITTPSDLDKLEDLDPQKDKSIQASTIHAKQLVEEFGIDRAIWYMTTGPLSNAARIVETEFLMECLIEDTDFVENLFKFSMDSFKAAVEPVLELGIDVLDFSSSPGSPDLISPKMYREFFWPYDKELVDWIHKKGAKAVFHICGDTMPIIKDMANTGADGISVDSMVDMSAARSVIGKTALVGNIDPAGVLMNGTPQIVETASIEAMKTGGLEGAFVLAPGCDVPPTCPSENIKAMIDSTMSHGRYPLRT
jgi:MtaA/CmuA family methyltransferase